jgi:hypothetical protein
MAAIIDRRRPRYCPQRERGAAGRRRRRPARREAQAWLTVRTHDGQVPLTSDELTDFAFDGQPFKLMDRQRGIRKPRELDAALSIRTVYRRGRCAAVRGRGRSGRPPALQVAG